MKVFFDKKSFMSVVITMFFLMFSFVSGASAETSDAKQYLNKLSSNKIEVRIMAAGDIASSGIDDPVLFDEIEKRLMQNYASENLRLNEIDLLSWYCRDLSSSGLMKYQTTLKEVADKSPYTKVRHYAKQSLILLSDNKDSKKSLSLTKKNSLPTLDKKNARLLTMLRSDNLKNESDAAKLVSKSINIDQTVYDEIENQLLNRYQSIGDDEKLIDLMSWYCKTLASSGQDSYKQTVETVLHNANSSKLKKYAKLSLNSFASNAEKHKKINQSIDAGYSENSALIINDLKSVDVATKIKACKRIVGSDHVESGVFNAVEKELLFGLTQQPIEEDFESYDVSPQPRLWKISRSMGMILGYDAMYAEAMSWMCKVLSSSGDAKYKKTLKEVIDSTNSAKIKGYARSAYKKL